MKKFYLLICVIVAISSITQAQTNPIFATKPSISPDGSQVAFSYQGDIWVMAANGGTARRLTIHPAYETNPIWSPDGKSIAFNSNRLSNQDIFTIPAQGGQVKRITYHSTTDAVGSWVNNQIVFNSARRAFKQIEWASEIQAVNAKGGTPSRIMDALGYMPVQSPNGNLIAFVKGACRISREAYQGPANKNIWIYNTKTRKYTQISQSKFNEYQPVWGNDNTLYYIGAATGRYNIYSQKINADGSANGQPAQITKFKDDGVRYIGASQNGKLVFERQVSLYTMNASGGTPQRLNIQATSDSRFDPMEHKTYRNNVSSYELSPSGKYIAMEIRGEIFIKPTKRDKRRAVNISKHAYRDRYPTWLNDSTVIFVSDRDGQYDLYLARSADKKQGNLYQTLKTEVVRLTNTKVDESEPIMSPNRKKIAFQRGRGDLVVANISTAGKLSAEKTLVKGWDAPGGVAWSPDSRWVAYALSDLNFNREVYIHAADNSKPAVNISMHPRRDQSPVWSPDGSKLGFISNRINDYDIWFVWLNKKDWELSRKDREEGNYYDNPDAKKKKKRKKSKAVKIDFDNIHDRMVRVTSKPGDEFDFAFNQKGDKLYFTANSPTNRRRDLYQAKWDGTKMRTITKNGKNPAGLNLAPKGRQLYFVTRGMVQQMSTKGNRVAPLPHEAKMVINHPQERAQIFEEAWRNLNAGFYDPNFHGQNFEALRKKYKPWALQASTVQDFREIYNLMLGQLNASHMGLRGRSIPERTQRERTGFLGIEVEPAKGGVKVTHVIANSPADKTESKINKGEVITAVNGQSIGANTNFYSLLTNTNNERIMLNVQGKGGNREVIIRPANSLGNLLYEEWISDKKALVEKYSNGRLGYIHIRGMNMPSFERFERELMASGYGKEGIVIDVRFNGGGWTTDYLMAVLNVQQHAYTIPRGAAKSLNENKKFRSYYPFSERLPLSSWTKPSVAMCNQNSYSNAEIFSHAYKHLGIGKLVGQPTFGAVISTGGARLIDGSLVRMPFRAWYVKATGENMEHGPAVPDFLIENAPDNRGKKEDAQLKKSVEVLLKQIGDKKNSTEKR
ncbi:peptidase S41 [marine bacterium AO1-C]|nr:peptidase S41 [marine bacterium AO1-C]